MDVGRWPKESQPVIGDDLYARFLEQSKAPPDVVVRGVMEQTVRNFLEWTLTTGDGALALKRINDTPRQLFLDFGDPRDEKEGTTG